MMKPHDIDLNLLVIFQEIYQHRKISSVAHRLALSQPTISNALARLRHTFGNELFVRTAQGMQPTPLAEQLAEPITAALRHVSQALNQQEKFSAANSKRHFTIAMTDVGEIYFMPLLIEQCSRIAPDIQISTVRASTINLKTAMESGHVDLAIGAFDNISGALYQRRLFRQNYVSMFRNGHPFHNKEVPLKDFLAAQHLIISSLESPYERVNQKLEKAGIRSTTRFRVPHFTAIPYIISNTDLIVTVPQKLAERAAQPFSLHYIHPPLRLPSLQTNIFWHRRFNQDEGNQWLRTLISAHFTE